MKQAVDLETGSQSTSINGDEPYPPLIRVAEGYGVRVIPVGGRGPIGHSRGSHSDPMPNQRSKNKVYLGGYIERDLHATIVRFAKQAGMEGNKFGYVAQLIQESIRRRKGAKRGP